MRYPLIGMNNYSAFRSRGGWGGAVRKEKEETCKDKMGEQSKVGKTDRSSEDGRRASAATSQRKLYPQMKEKDQKFGQTKKRWR